MVRGRLQLRLDRETEERIDALAAELGLSRSAVLRLAVAQLHRAQHQPLAAPTEEQIAAQRRKPGPRPSRAAARDQADAAAERPAP
jgi:antitoxin component of RelBE/YafQ-DinJ toxin-antitoxin module